jgi:hypothetical protein
MPRNTKNSTKDKSFASSAPSSQLGKGKKKKVANQSAASSTYGNQPLSAHELAILRDLEKHNKASVSAAQSQKDNGTSSFPILE